MWLYRGLYLLIYWDFDCSGKCGMDHYYASFRELESNFRPARVFHSAFAVTSYYAYLKQRMKTLFQISSLWATPHTLYTPSYSLHYHTKKRNDRPPHKCTRTLQTFSHTVSVVFIESNVTLSARHQIMLRQVRSGRKNLS